MAPRFPKNYRAKVASVIGSSGPLAVASAQPIKKRQRISVSSGQKAQRSRINAWLDKIGGVPGDVRLEVRINCQNLISSRLFLSCIDLQSSATP